jgi:hypothetical protein
LGGGILVAILLVLTSGSADAQTFEPREKADRPYQDPSVERRRSSPGANSPTDLPSWAEPSSGQSQNSSIGSKNVQTNNGAPPPPASPEPVPVNGGLALLAAAGAGYAVRKLNEDDEQDLTS